MNPSLTVLFENNEKIVINCCNYFNADCDTEHYKQMYVHVIRVQKCIQNIELIKLTIYES